MSNYDVFKYSTVYIESNDKNGNLTSGTGFFVGFENKPTVLVTAKHVVDKVKSNRISFHYMPSGSRHIATVAFECKLDWEESEDYDVCCCNLSDINKQFEKEIGFPIYHKHLNGDNILTEKDLQNVKVLEEVVMMGYPSGMKNTAFAYPLFTKGNLAVPPSDNHLNKEGYVNISAIGGSSGSPLLIQKENKYCLLGIMSKALMENPVSKADIGMYVDAYRLRELVKEV